MACAVAAALWSCGTLVDAGAKSGIKQLGPAGGAVESDLGVKLWLPPGALAADTTVSLAVLEPAPGGAERAVEVRPVELQLALPGVVTFAGPKSVPPKVARDVGGRWVALPGRRVDPSAVSAPIAAFGRLAVIASDEQCSGGVDEDGDGLADCRDPACAGDAACGLSCQTNGDCACGALCVGGGCSAPNPRFCSTGSDCAGLPCAAPVSHGQQCGFAACAVPGTAAGADGGAPPRTVAACASEADECACEPCAGTNECPAGTRCLPATHKGGRDLCGRDVCL